MLGQTELKLVVEYITDFKKKSTAEAGFGLDRETRIHLDRFNARMRHFQGVAASVMEQAVQVWLDLVKELEDPRTPEEIIDGVPLSDGALPACGWPARWSSKPSRQRSRQAAAVSAPPGHDW